MQKVLTVFGTRPEAIKIAPVILALNATFDVRICVTGQHKQMLDQVLKVFEIVPDYNFDIMVDDQGLNTTSARILVEMEKVLTLVQPDIVLVQGDTTTALSVALASFYRGIKVGHIEAGLRTHDFSSPFPEELNRQLISRIASLHFAPTVVAQDNLIKEGIPSNIIYVTGNTVIDSLQMAVGKTSLVKFSEEVCRVAPFLRETVQKKPTIILVTGHRREHFGQKFENICKAIKEIANQNREVAVIYPVHLNPNVQEPVNRILSNINNVCLLPPLDYLSFVKLLELSKLVLTDSGGIQEEAPSLGKPVLVMRKNTERPEGIKAGTARVVGITVSEISSTVKKLLKNKDLYEAMSSSQNPYGDGLASKRIKEILETVIV